MSDDQMNEDAGIAFGATEAVGGAIAAAAGIGAEVAALPVTVAAAAGVAIGTGIEYATDGAISDAIAEGLHDLVGDEESLAAAHAFDDGNYFAAAGHMLAGAGETIGDAAGDAVDWAGETAGDAVDWAGETAGDAVDAVSDWVSDVDLNPFD